MKTITLTGNLEGKTMVCGLHQFVNGEKEFANDTDADKAFNFLRKYWTVKIDVEPEAVKEPEATPYLQDSGPKVVDPHVTAADETPEVEVAKPTPKPTPAAKPAAAAKASK